jgi:hypothetical protein
MGEEVLHNYTEIKAVRQLSRFTATFRGGGVPTAPPPRFSCRGPERCFAVSAAS